MIITNAHVYTLNFRVTLDTIIIIWKKVEFYINNSEDCWIRYTGTHFFYLGFQLNRNDTTNCISTVCPCACMPASPECSCHCEWTRFSDCVNTDT